jgi:uracil-DNA glycosylase
MEAVSRSVLAGNVHALPQGRHWYQTHCLAFVLLRVFDPKMRLDTVSRFFAHMNSAKCCVNNPHRQKGDPVLFRNCSGYIPDEIRILRPDILITQGGEAREAVEGRFPQLERRRLNACAEPCEYEILETSPGHRAIHFAIHHPRRYSHYWSQQRACWSNYADAAKSFRHREPIHRPASRS